MLLFTEAAIEIEFTANTNGLLSRMVSFNETLPSYIANENDEIYVVEGNISGQILTSTYDLDVDYGISVYPNPASDILNISSTELSGETLQNAQVVILDPVGRVVYTDISIATSISLEGFSNGLHTLSVITNEGIDSKQFMISN